MRYKYGASTDKIFLKYCNEIVTSLENAELELNDYKGNETSNVSINVESASLLIFDIMEELRNTFPQIMPHIFQSGCTDWDLKIHSDYSNACNETILLEEAIGVVMPKTHTLTEKSVITKPDLAKYDFISLSSECNLYKIISHFCEKENFTQGISMFIDSPH